MRGNCCTGLRHGCFCQARVMVSAASLSGQQAGRTPPMWRTVLQQQFWDGAARHDEVRPPMWRTVLQRQFSDGAGRHDEVRPPMWRTGLQQQFWDGAARHDEVSSRQRQGVRHRQFLQRHAEQ